MTRIRMPAMRETSGWRETPTTMSDLLGRRLRAGRGGRPATAAPASIVPRPAGARHHPSRGSAPGPAVGAQCDRHDPFTVSQRGAPYPRAGSYPGPPERRRSGARRVASSMMMARVRQEDGMRRGSFVARVAGLAVLLAVALPASAAALTIYPIDRAQILVGARFDLKVEFDGVVPAADVRVAINGRDHAQGLGGAAPFVEKEAGVEGSALILRDTALSAPGRYTVTATDGRQSATVTWDVYATGPRKAKNVILFIGDGMSVAHRTAARILSKGIAEGKYRGKLATDTMPHMAIGGP